MKKKLLASVSVLLLGTMMLTGCGSSAGVAEGDKGTTQTTESVKIQAVGSTTVAVPMDELVLKYKEKNPEVVIEVQGVGSSAGVKAAHEKTADIGMVSREIKDSEKEYGLTETVIAYDGIAVVLNPANGVEDLSSEQVKGIFEGTITNWSEVGGVDENIIVVTREDGSGTRSAFEEILGLQKEIGDKKVSSITQSALVAEGNGTIKATVASKTGAVGYVSLGFIDETVKVISVDGVIPTPESVKASKYSVSRPLLILTQPDAPAHVQEYVDFILGTEGQEVVSEKYIPVN
ncbi:MAG: phosphate ABC transporter substrate-binding protein [Cellulosilyticaceae bacterium]